MDPRYLRSGLADWLDSYRAQNRALLEADPEFRHWLETEYKPIAGGWQY